MRLALRRLGPLAAAATLRGGCATRRVAADWSDPEFKARSLRGERIPVVCDADSTAAKRICEDQFAVELRAAGASPVGGPEAATLGAGPAPTNDKTLDVPQSTACVKTEMERGARAVKTSGAKAQ